MVVPFLNIPIISVVMMLLAGILIGNLIWYRDRSDDEASLVGLRGENSELQAALHEHKQAYVELEADVEDRRKEWDQLKTAVRHLEQSQQEGEREKQGFTDELARLQQLKDQAFHDLDQERQQRRALQEALTQAEETIARANSFTEQLQSQVGAFQSEREEFDQIVQTRAAEMRSIEVRLQGEIDELQQERDALSVRAEKAHEIVEQSQVGTQRLQEAQLSLDRAHAELKSQSESIESLRNERDELAEQKQADAERLQELQLGLDRAQEELKSQSESFELRRNDREELVEQKEALTQQLHELKQSLDRAQADAKSHGEALESLRSDRDELAKQVDDERLSREELEKRLVQVDLVLAQRDEAMERANVAEGEIAELKKNLADEQSKTQQHHDRSQQAANTLQEQNEELKGKLAALTQEHDAVATMLVDERTRLSKMEADNHRLSLAAAEQTEKSDQAVVELRRQLDTQVAELETLRRELEETAAQFSRERHQREHLQDVLDNRQVESDRSKQEHEKLTDSVTTLTTQNDSLRNQVNELQAIRGEHESVKRILADTTSQLHDLRESYEKTSGQREELKLQLDEMTQRIAQVASVRESYGVQLSQLQTTHESTLAERLKLESAVEQLKLEISRLDDAERERSDEVQELRSQLSDYADLKADFNEQQARLDKLVAQRDEAMATSSATEENVKSLRAQLETESRALSSLNQQHDQLKAKYGDYDELRAQILSQTMKMNETAERLRRVTAERDGMLSASRDGEHGFEQLQARVKSQEETIRNLRRERSAVIARARQPVVPAAPYATHSVPEESGGRMRRDEVLGMVYTQPPKQKDDLKRISGIAQVLERKLNAFGVYTYRQIMEWDEVAIAEFSKLLSFRDRIDRDDWIGQARNLHFETYDRAA